MYGVSKSLPALIGRFGVALGVLLAGCVNPYAQFYQGKSGATELPGYIDTGEPPKIFASDDLARDVDSMLRRGYSIIGSSSFVGTAAVGGQSAVLAQAQKVKAQVVLQRTKYLSTQTGVLPLTVPTTSTSYTNGSATAFGAGGSVTAYGSSTTTTYGTKTTMIPYSVDRSDFGAVYLAKVRPRMGVFVKPLDDEGRRKLGSNTGLVVGIVVDDSPAFMADVLPGDILLSIGDAPMTSIEAFSRALDELGGSKVTVRVRRGEDVLSKSITLGHY